MAAVVGGLPATAWAQVVETEGAEADVITSEEASGAADEVGSDDQSVDARYRVWGESLDIADFDAAKSDELTAIYQQARIDIDMSRLLCLKAADMMDKAGNKAAQAEIAMIKVVAPNMACQVIDWAMQVHGGGGVSDDFGLARAYAGARTLRFADGPDEVHRNAIAKMELGEQTTIAEATRPRK